MAKDLSVLDHDFADTVRLVLSDCLKSGVEMVPYFTLRSPQDQAKLYRQSRSTQEIEASVDYLRSNGATWLAQVLEDVGTQPSGAWATNSLPGFSWHQHGEAVDCFWMHGNVVDWKVDKNDPNNGYVIYAGIAQNNHGLTAGLFWSHPDNDHLQKQSKEIPDLIADGTLTFQSIDAKMQSMFGAQA